MLEIRRLLIHVTIVAVSLSQLSCAFATPPVEFDTKTALAAIYIKKHPRTLTGTLAASNETLSRLRSHVEQHATEALPADPSKEGLSGPATSIHDSRTDKIQTLIFSEENTVLSAAIGWYATHDVALLEEARRRALNLASWSPRGASGFRTHDQAGLSVAWTLALAYDWLYEHWTAADREKLLSAIRPRLEDILSRDAPYGLDHGRKLDRWTHDSHGAVALARTAAICTALAGEDALFDQCFRDIVPRYLARPIPWGEDDGGYANGTNYAQWDVLFTHFVVWDLLRNALGVDLWQTPWAQNHGRFLAYFLPPGTPSGLFGDGAEKNWREVWATQATAYASHAASPLADWYARSQFGENPAQLAQLLAPQRDWDMVSGTLPPGVPDSIQLPSIGWVAMHSELGDRARTSVYFKSSPYGSYNHSHADQNSLVINAKGRRLAIDSGYYDYYNSPHWKDWYKQTRAHNAITFDGGQGQLHDTMAARGKVTQFEHMPGYDLVTGDAREAYGGKLTQATRSMVYVRPGTILVFDSLASDTPHAWEWNIHALKEMAVTGKRSFEINNEGVRLCVEVLSGGEMEFSQTDRFASPPSGDFPRQWHGAFRSKTKSASFQMLTMLSVNCEKTSTKVEEFHDHLEVGVAGQHFAFTNAKVERIQ